MMRSSVLLLLLPLLVDANEEAVFQEEAFGLDYGGKDFDYVSLLDVGSYERKWRKQKPTKWPDDLPIYNFSWSSDMTTDAHWKLLDGTILNSGRAKVCYSCVKNDHVLFNQPMSHGEGVGARLLMDNYNSSYCITKNRPPPNSTTGHIGSDQYMHFGKVDVYARLSHSALDDTQPSPYNAVSCIGLYIGAGTAGWHNEVSYCVGARSGTRNISMGMWTGFKQGDHCDCIHYISPTDLGQSFNMYTIEWTPEHLTMSINGEEIYARHGKAGRDPEFNATTQTSANNVTWLPWEPMSLRLIHRPTNADFIDPPSVMEVKSVTYTTLSELLASQANDDGGEGGAGGGGGGGDASPGDEIEG